MGVVELNFTSYKRAVKKLRYLKPIEMSCRSYRPYEKWNLLEYSAIDNIFLKLYYEVLL